jgi:SAM-dependent methyltransferase
VADPTAYVQSLLVMNALVEPVTRGAIRALELPTGSCGLDAGCGIGLEAVLLAQAIGPTGHVTGVDLAPEHVTYGRELVARAGLRERIALHEGDLRALPFANGAFDWAWAKDCVATVPQLGLEAVSLVQELTRVVRPGGTVAILAWSSQMLLPGFPGLEARLNATAAGMAPFTASNPPESHFLRGLGWLRRAGLKDLSVRTLAGDAHAPLSADVRGALIELFQERWSGAESELAPVDRAAYQRLCRRESPDCILNHPDYYAFWTYSVLRGVVARG